jgi:hypothetical protein
MNASLDSNQRQAVRKGVIGPFLARQIGTETTKIR